MITKVSSNVMQRHSFKFIATAGDASPIACDVGDEINLTEEVRIRVGDAQGNALLEVASGGLNKVFVNGEPVLDVCHIVPEQTISVGGVSYVYLAYGRMHFVKRPEEIRRELYVKMVSASLRKAIDQVAQRPIPTIGLARKDAAQSSYLRKVKVSGRFKKKNILISATAIFAFVSAALLFLSLDSAEDGLVDDVEIVAAEDGAEGAALVDDSRQREPLEEIENESAPGEVADEGFTAASDATKSIEAANEDATETVSKPVQQVTKPAPSAVKHLVVDPEVIAEVRQKISSYRLEAGFDPESAKKRLEEIIKDYPGTSLAQEARRAINDIKRHYGML